MFYWLYCHHWDVGNREYQFYPDKVQTMYKFIDGLVRTGWEVKIKVFNNTEV